MSNSSRTIKIIFSREEFRGHSGSWNDLWQRSSSANPTGRAETIDLWCQTFAPNDIFRAVIVADERENRWTAGIVLLKKRKMKILSVGTSPRLTTPVLLIDPMDRAEDSMKMLVAALREQTVFQWIWPENIRLDSWKWTLLQNMLRELAIPFQRLQTHKTAVIPMNGTFADLLARWNKGKNSEVRRLLKKLGETGHLELVCLHEPEKLEEMLPRCFEIENQSWKGSRDEGLSIIKRGLQPYYAGLAKQLAENREMFLFGLVLDGTWIAFQYDYAAKDTIFCNKISYLPEYKQYSPGFLLHHWICEYLRLRHPEIVKFDYVGKFMPYQSHWNPELEAVGQIVFPTDSLSGQMTFFLYKTLMPIIRRCR